MYLLRGESETDADRVRAFIGDFGFVRALVIRIGILKLMRTENKFNIFFILIGLYYRKIILVSVGSLHYGM